MGRKTVQFDYLKFFYYAEADNGVLVETPLDLSELFRKIEENDVTKTCRLINDEEHRFHVCSRNDDINTWEVQLLRQREELRPGISNQDGSYALISLDEGQYVAESSTLIYDEETATVLFQRNRFGYSIHSLLEYIKLFYDNKVNIFIKPILKFNQIDKITDSSIYRKVLLVSDGTIECSSQNSSLMKILRNFEEYEGKYITIEISMGRIQKRNLKAKATADLIREAYTSQCTTHLVARLASSSDAQIETIDLLSDRESVVFSLEYSRSNPITHERLFMSCIDEYISLKQG